jgi:hypothetical protein
MRLVLWVRFPGNLKQATGSLWRMPMQYDLRRALRPRLILPCMALALTACAGGPPIVAASNACSALLPQQWRSPVLGAPLPGSDTIGEWIVFADAQTAQLDKANDRTLAAIGIVERCEARDAAALAASRRPWWKFWP